jgi:fermentation-respiration switch protein FrsA (DUF1100 family)
MSFIYYKVGNALIHRNSEVPKEMKLDSKEFPWEPVTFKSNHGNITLKGILFTAIPKSNKTLIVIHGLGENRLMSGRTEILVRYFIPRGYNLLAFDLRGHGESEGDLITFGYYEKYDVTGAIEYLKERGIEGQRIGLIGFSMGAITAIEAAGKDDRVNVLIADSAIRDLKLFVSEDLNNLSNDLDVLLNNLGGTSYCSILRYLPLKNKIIPITASLYGLKINEVSPMNTARKINKKPILLIHSKSDKFIPYRNSEDIFKSIEYNPNTALWLTEKADHIDSLKMYPLEYLKKIENFLEKSM